MFTKCEYCFEMQEILRDEFDDPEFLEFAIENHSEIFGYIATGRVNIRVHRDVLQMRCGLAWDELRFLRIYR
jgi:hypothetical protein